MFSAFFYLGIIVKVGILVGGDFYLRENILEWQSGLGMFYADFFG